MRIAVFTHAFPSTVNTFFARDMRGLLNRGHEIDVYPLYPEDQRYWSLVPKELNLEVLPPDRIHYLKWKHGRSRKAITATAKLHFLSRAGRALASATKYGFSTTAKTAYAAAAGWRWAGIESKPYDHILAYWGHFPATAAYLYLTLLGKEVPFTIMLHAGVDLYRNQVCLKEKLHAADAILTVCNFNRKFLRELYPKDFAFFDRKLSIHYIGVDLNDLPFSLEGRNTDLVINVAGLLPLKGQSYLLEALKILNGKGLRYRCEFFGDGPDRPKLERLACRLDLKPRPVFHGWQPFEVVRKAMQTATALVHPSPGIGDSTTSVAKEAMALGLPVVASEVAGIPEVLGFGKCGILVKPKSPLSLADAISSLLGSPELRKSIALAGRAHAEQLFDTHRNAAHLSAVLESASRAKATQ